MKTAEIVEGAVYRVRREMGLAPRAFPPRKDMMLGAVVGVCRVVGWEWHPYGWESTTYASCTGRLTRSSDGYKIASQGAGPRMGSLVLADVERIEPIPLVGFQGIFNVDPPNDMELKPMRLRSAEETDDMLRRIEAMTARYKALDAKHKAEERRDRLIEKAKL